MPALLFLPHTQLHTHPRNMRRFYPAADVRQMADSLLANRGNLQAMIITPDPALSAVEGPAPSIPSGVERSGTQSKNEGGDGFYVVDGNLRLAAARLLGPHCPPLKCEVVRQSQADQLLSMILSNTLRFDPDPVSEGLHYRALLAEGLSVAEISRRTGVYESRIRGRLRLADLDDPLQQLVLEARLSHDPRVVEALLAIPDPDARLKLVKKFTDAGRGKNIQALVVAAQTLAEKLGSSSRTRQRGRPRRPQAGWGAVVSRSATLPPPSAPATLAAIRESARQSCAACDLKASPAIRAIPEPAWSLVAHAADQTCAACNLADIETVCNGCPLPDMLQRLIAIAETTP